MATFKITAASSVTTSADDDPAFDSDTIGADKLIVDPAAFLNSTGAASSGVLLANTGAWGVTVNGSISSQQYVALLLSAGNASSSTVTVNSDGEISGVIGIAAKSAITIKNAGSIAGAEIGVQIQNAGTHAITNSGSLIGTNFSILDESGLSVEKITNSGTLIGVVSLGGGNDTLSNSGQITDDVDLGSGINKLGNSGTILGNIIGGADIDNVTNTGTLSGVVDLKDGNDIFTGGSAAETFVDGGGTDRAKLGGGNDTYIATGHTGADVSDFIDGGGGIDTYDASGAIDSVFINLDGVTHDLSPVSPGTLPVAARTANGLSVAEQDKDSIVAFENAKGGSASDVLFGTAGVNALDGGGSVDYLFGYSGNDTLIGGVGAFRDVLVGGLGKDTLTGGDGDDLFIFNQIKESGLTEATRDVITDFSGSGGQGDVIDLKVIVLAGNVGFNFIGTNVSFTGIAGEIRAFWTATGQIVEGDVTGDAKADFSIEIVDPIHAITLTSADFAI